jgi:acyl dehydratase/NAD(P)-dependent dehydrogenase (short-subunit alcohol dehydrogenase family)
MTATTTRFALADQRRFARLSGDFNPAHIDPAYALRAMAGQPIVHGMHLVLRVLDAHFRKHRTVAGSIQIAAQFLKPAFLGEPITIEQVRTGASEYRFAIRAGVTLALVGLTEAVGVRQAAAGRRRERKASARVYGARPRTAPVVRTLDDLDHAQGVTTVDGGASARLMFENASRVLGSEAVASLARISGVVGMECPGRDSLLSKLALRVRPGARPAALTWRVTHIERRWRGVTIEVTADGIAGTVEAFVAPAAPAAPDVSAIQSQVSRDEFAGQRALIVGGSRGLGAAVAVLVAVGGGVPLVTYRTGHREVTDLQQQLEAVGLHAEALQFDTSGPMMALADAAARFGVTHLYYFATPKIFARRQPPFDMTLFRRFADVYVDGFARTCAAVKLRGRSLTVLYPSTTAIDAPIPDLTEYAAAKAAGEALCRVLETTMVDLRVIVGRLPRTATTQTRAFVSVPAQAPVDVMLPIVRSMQQAARA